MSDKITRGEWAAMLLVAFFIWGPLAIHPAEELAKAKWDQGGANTLNPGATLGWLTLGVLVFQSYIFSRQAGISDRQRELMEGQANSLKSQMEIMAAQTDLMIKQKEIARQGHIATHRPRLVIRNATLTVSSAPHQVCVLANVVNIGGSSGIVVESWIEATNVDSNFGKFETFPRRESFFVGRSIKPGEDCRFSTMSPTSSPIFINMKNAAKYNKASDDLFVFRGAIVYEDGNGILYRTAWWRQYDFVGKRFVRTNDIDYEYED